MSGCCAHQRGQWSQSSCEVCTTQTVTGRSCILGAAGMHVTCVAGADGRRWDGAGALACNGNAGAVRLAGLGERLRVGTAHRRKVGGADAHGRK